MAKKKGLRGPNEKRYPEGVAITHAEAGILPFPDPTNVFANRVEEYSEFLLPAVSIQLSRVIPGDRGIVHLIIPIEPLDGALGENSSQWHTRYCMDDWLGYQMIGDRCELLTDPDFFIRSQYALHPPSNPIEEEEFVELQKHYTKIRTAFELRRDFFRSHGWLHNSPETFNDHHDENEYGTNLIDDLGGTSFDGNWSQNGWPSSLPISRYPDPIRFPPTAHGSPNIGRVVPKTTEGRDFHYIGSVGMWNFIGDTNGAILLFFEPVDRIAVTVIDWT